MNIGYVRVSTVDQNEQRQLVTMEKYKCDKVFMEKVSAKDTNRPQLQELKNMIENIYNYKKSMNELTEIKDGKEESVTIATVIIHDFSRLARSTKDLLELVEYFQSKQVALISSKENVDSSTPTGKLMLTMIGAINEFERANLLERQREGIAIAKKKGKYKGRKGIEIADTFKALYECYINREINKTAFAKELEVSRPTLDKMIKKYQEQQIATNETRVKAHANALGLIITSYDKKINELSEKQIKEVMQQIEYGSGDVEVKIKNKAYVVEVSLCDNEVDLYVYTKQEYVNKYGELE